MEWLFLHKSSIAMKKTSLLIFISLLLASMSLSAGTTDTLMVKTDRFATMKRPYIIDLTIGKIIHTGGDPGVPYFGRRKSVNTEVSLRMAGFFNKYIGAYGSMAFCGVPWKDRWKPGDGYDHAVEDDPMAMSITSLIQAGAIFRYEIRRWQLYTRLGLGVRGMAYDTYYYYKLLPDGDVDYYSEYIKTKLIVRPFVVVGGLTVGYRLSRVVSLVLDMDYRHRIGMADDMVIEKKLDGEDGEDIILERSVHKTKVFGKELALRLGFQFQCELSGSGKKKNKATKKAP